MKRKILILLAVLLISILLLEAINLSVFAKYKDKHKHKKMKHMGLVYKDVKQTHSSLRVQTDSGVLVDDPESVLNFVLTQQQVVLVLLNSATTTIGTTMGMINALNIDGAVVALSHNSPGGIVAQGEELFWVGQLAAGPHTIKGQFARISAGTTVYINERRLTALIFDGQVADFSFVRNVNAVNTNLGTLQNDAFATINLNLATAQKALILYHACNYDGTAEGARGKSIAIQVDGADGLDFGNERGSGVTYPDASFVATVQSLSAGIHTIQGRYRSNEAGFTVTISERQIAILLFDTTLESDFASSLNVQSTVGSSYVDDNSAQILRIISGAHYLLSIYVAGDILQSLGEVTTGLKTAINDGVNDHEKGVSCCSPGGATGEVLSSPIHTLVGISTGLQTIKGRFAAVGASSVTIRRRILCCLWFVPPSPPTLPPKAFQKKEEKQEANRDPPIGFTRMRVLRRVTRIVPWVV